MKQLMLDGGVQGLDFLGGVDDGLWADVGVAGDRPVEAGLLLAVAGVGDCAGLAT